jgi:hypothetical protein
MLTVTRTLPLFFLLCLAGCEAVEQALTPQEDAAIVVLNVGENEVEGLYLARCSDSEWGDNRLEGGPPLTGGSLREFLVEPDCWYMYAQTETGDLANAGQLAEGGAFRWTIDGGWTPSGPGSSWSSVALPEGTSGSWQVAAFGDGGWAALGPTMRGRSADGASWTVDNVDDRSTVYRDMEFGDGVFAASTSNGVSTSTDGRLWTHHAIPSAESLRAIAYGGGRWVVGDDRSQADDFLGFAISEDQGATWEYVTTELPAGTPFAMIWAQGQFVVVGYWGLVATSPDGRTWTEHPFPNIGEPLHLLGVAYGNGRYLAVGNPASIWASSDARSWTAIEPNARPLFRSIAFGDDVFVGVGNNAAIWTSRTGASWSRRSFPDSYRFSYVAYGGGHFVAIGDWGLGVSN